MMDRHFLQAIPHHCHATANAAVTEMIVVGADHNGFVRQRSVAFQDADDILQVNFVAAHLQFKGDRPPFQFETLRLQIVIDVRFDR